jgi:hypothetical protein
MTQGRFAVGTGKYNELQLLTSYNVLMLPFRGSLHAVAISILLFKKSSHPIYIS